MTSLSIPMTQAGIGGLGPWELLIVLAILLVLFGAGRLPTIGKSLGEAFRNFKKGIKGEEDTEPKAPHKK